MGYIHLDIKPENVLVTPNGHLALADFGLAYRVTPDNALCEWHCGTTCYEAPEVLAENLFGMSGCDQRADVWSLGIVILQMFAHDERPPHDRTGEPSAEKRLRTLIMDPRKLWEMRYIQNHVPELYDLLCKVCLQWNKTFFNSHNLFQMLERDPRLRIDIQGVKAHQYFRGLDWEKLLDTTRAFSFYNLSLSNCKPPSSGHSCSTRR